MTHPRKILFVFPLLFLFLPLSKGQESFGVSGVNAAGTNGSASFSVGQFVYNTLTGITGTVVQGVQQPYEISVVTAIEDGPESSLEYTVYPNPAKGHLKFKAGTDSYEDLKIKLIDFRGVVLHEMKPESAETIISLEGYPPAVYFLKIYRNNNEVKVFRIIKN